jgi:Rod binding domain-containing protein
MNLSSVSSVTSTLAPAAPDPSISKGRTDKTTDADRKRVSAQFEAILVRQLLGKSVSSMVGGSGDVAGSVYGDLMTDMLAQKLTAGQGLGLGRFIEKQLTPRGTPADAPKPIPSLP